MKVDIDPQPLRSSLARLQAAVACCVAVAGLLGCGGASAQTITATKSLTLSATLSAQCRVATASAGTITLTFPSYTAFGAGVSAPAQTINFECTRGLAATPTFQWDTTNGTSAGEGVLAGLRYALTASNGARSNGLAPALATAGDIGTPDTYPVSVSGSMPANQAGAGASGIYTTTRTLTVTF